MRRRLASASAGLASVVVVLSFVTPARANDAQPPAPREPTFRAVVVTDDAGQADAVADRLRSLSGLTEAGLRVIAAAPGGRVVTVEVPIDEATTVAAAITAENDVSALVPETTYTLFDTPNDPLYGDQRSSLKALRLPRAWDVTRGSGSVVVAVIDSGVEVGHPDLAGKVVDQHDAASGGSSVTDAVGHGTMVASMIGAGTNNSTGMAGSGWDTSILAVKVAGADKRITNASLANGIDWAVARGADVINLSLGSESNDVAVRAAVADAVAADVVVVAAAGNSGGTEKFYPAALPDVLAVGATTRAGGNRAGFSQRGSWVDVGAPGVSILGASADHDFGPDYDSGDGTSFASPLVAGVAALVRASRPELDQKGVRRAITATATNKDYGFRHGLVDAYEALGHELVLGGPTVLSPTAGATVAGNITVTVGGVPASASHVRAALIGAATSVRVPLVAGAATFSLPSDGSSGLETLRVVACRQSLCSKTGTNVDLDVDNPAPTITAPSDGSAVTQAFGLTATSASAGVRFVADGATSLGTDLEAPFAVTVPVTKLSPGPHVITAIACDDEGKTCASNNPSAPIGVTVARLSPVITRLTPNPFSPDGDGRRDRTTLRYELDVASTVTIEIRQSNGATFTTKALGRNGAGPHAWKWSARGPDGVVARSGTYTLVLSSFATVSGVLLQGQAKRQLVIDTVDPSLTRRATSLSTVYPVKDGYRDTTALSVKVDEQAKTLTAQVSNAKGSTVWKKSKSAVGPGKVRFTFGGRSTSGQRLDPGAYRFSFVAKDKAGNVSASKSNRIKVSSKRLSKPKQATKTVTAEKSVDGWSAAEGDTCSGVYRSGWAPGALVWDACVGGGVFTLHHVGIPEAVKYGRGRVATYARGYGTSPGYLYYVDDRDDLIGPTKLGPATGTHTGDSVKITSRLLKGKSLRWVLLVEGGARYEAKTFTVTWTYYTLV